jgi:hypothetical protein
MNYFLDPPFYRHDGASHGTDLAAPFSLATQPTALRVCHSFVVLSAH